MLRTQTFLQFPSHLGLFQSLESVSSLIGLPGLWGLSPGTSRVLPGPRCLGEGQGRSLAVSTHPWWPQLKKGFCVSSAQLWDLPHPPRPPQAKERLWGPKDPYGGLTCSIQL